jgi:hypothetical protein
MVSLLSPYFLEMCMLKATYDQQSLFHFSCEYVEVNLWQQDDLGNVAIPTALSKLSKSNSFSPWFIIARHVLVCCKYDAVPEIFQFPIFWSAH